MQLLHQRKLYGLACRHECLLTCLPACLVCFYFVTLALFYVCLSCAYIAQSVSVWYFTAAWQPSDFALMLSPAPCHKNSVRRWSMFVEFVKFFFCCVCVSAYVVVVLSWREFAVSLCVYACLPALPLSVFPLWERLVFGGCLSGACVHLRCFPTIEAANVFGWRHRRSLVVVLVCIWLFMLSVQSLCVCVWRFERTTSQKISSGYIGRLAVNQSSF